MNQADTPFQALRQSADEAAVAAIEQLVREAPDHALYPTNALAFAARNGLDEEPVIAAFLHAARLGLFELSWNVLCPGCGGVLDAGTTLKTVNRAEYSCALCAAGYEPTLDEMVGDLHGQPAGAPGRSPRSEQPPDVGLLPSDLLGLGGRSAERSARDHRRDHARGDR